MRFKTQSKIYFIGDISYAIVIILINTKSNFKLISEKVGFYLCKKGLLIIKRILTT
ncbi:Conserved hypothetical protein [Clostridium neonatale]|uniref:Uncharacterized protein n=1 Tax=Clostridium neonatale TaxID=137838 RepID=A0AA86JHT9_9CLOT|nr:MULTISPECIES: hypothetical protein [Clostridium]CAG9709020.1 Conserved hypothetical protein [Clostridium neonatale]CAG9711526.1 Conserved hypothetical protein [Clostridium neonatale]CAG9718508.1 Conserved hypothetical protein [Clostridium neonatale]CAH0436539.1 Conserved hypothetical protein [Clostridium neonatale]CAI3192534.1 Conserved hypothetical protein [Clostridium neonatale]